MLPAAFVAFCLAAADCAAPPPAATAARPPAREPFEREGRAVVVFDAVVQTGPGAGRLLGRVAAGTVVGLGQLEGEWRQVELEGIVRATAWVPRERLGCRALRDVELAPLDGSKPLVLVRSGALLAIAAVDGERLEVETQGPIAVRGRIAAAECGVGHPFVPTLPRDGLLSVLTRDAILVTDAAPEGALRLPAGQRFAVFSTKRVDHGVVYGRTDGPVVLRGQIDAYALAQDGSTPLDRLAEPLGYTHESLLDAALLDEPGSGGVVVARLSAGAPLVVEERRGSWARVTTHGAVRLGGWIEADRLRRVALDENELDPASRRRSHAPVVRDAPIGLDSPEDDE